MNPYAERDIKPCGECGADNDLSRQTCWMCHADLRKSATQIVTAELVDARAPRFAPSGTFFGVLTLLVTLLVVLVGFALGEMSLGYLPFFALVVIPALLATTVRVGRRRMHGKEVSWTEAVLTVLISGVIMKGVLALIGMAIIAALFIMCLINPPRFGH